MFKKPINAFDDWDDAYSGYNEAQYEKVVEPEDFKNAVKVYEELKSKNKKSKHEKKTEKILREKGLLNEKKNDDKKIFEMPATQNPLLTLTYNVFYEEKNIDQGFYLVDMIKRDGNYYIRLSEGYGNNIVDIAAKAIEHDASIVEKPIVYTKLVENNLLKLSYSKNDLILEAYLLVR